MQIIKEKTLEALNGYFENCTYILNLSDYTIASTIKKFNSCFKNVDVMRVSKIVSDYKAEKRISNHE